MKNPFKSEPVTISEKIQMTPNQVRFSLETKLDFIPGQFIEISLPGFGEGPVAPCGDPINNDILEIVVRDVGGLTTKINSLLVGDGLNLRGPFGNGWPIQKLKKHDILILSGGMGIIPLRPLILYILKNLKSFGKIYLLLGGRDPESFLFRENFEEWKKHFNHFKTIVDKAPKNYKGREGVITELIKPLPLDSSKTFVVMCGPEPMYKPSIDALLSKNISANQIYVSLERRMKCGIGLCQHCNCGKYLVCKDGPVFSWSEIQDELGK